MTKRVTQTIGTNFDMIISIEIHALGEVLSIRKDL